MKELIKEFNKYLYAEYGVTLDCNYNKDEMYLMCSFIKETLVQSSSYMRDFCDVDLIKHLLETINLGKPETVFQQMKYVQLHARMENKEVI